MYSKFVFCYTVQLFIPAEATTERKRKKRAGPFSIFFLPFTRALVAAGSQQKLVFEQILGWTQPSIKLRRIFRLLWRILSPYKNVRCLGFTFVIFTSYFKKILQVRLIFMTQILIKEKKIIMIKTK